MICYRGDRRALKSLMRNLQDHTLCANIYLTPAHDHLPKARICCSGAAAAVLQMSATGWSGGGLSKQTRASLHTSRTGCRRHAPAVVFGCWSSAAAAKAPSPSMTGEAAAAADVPLAAA